MPELPDLQVFSRNLQKKLAGKKVKRITVTSKKVKTPAKEFKAKIEGAKLEKVYREGKELRLEFNNGDIVGLHLMLHGKLFIFEKDHAHKYPIIEFLFDDDEGLVMTDYQGIALPSLNPAENNVPDALSKEMNFSIFISQLAKKKTNIKNILLDQHVVRGIGNAYADEILWAAGISPLSRASKIPGEKIKLLVSSVKKILKDAEKQIIKADPEIISGEIRDFLKIHNAKKKESPTGKAIRQASVNGRKTYFTDEQVLYK